MLLRCSFSDLNFFPYCWYPFIEMPCGRQGKLLPLCLDLSSLDLLCGCLLERLCPEIYLFDALEVRHLTVDLFYIFICHILDLSFALALEPIAISASGSPYHSSGTETFVQQSRILSQSAPMFSSSRIRGSRRSGSEERSRSIEASVITSYGAGKITLRLVCAKVYG